MVKKITALLLVISMMMTFTFSSFGATDAEIYAGNQLRILGILKGYEDGSLKLDNSIVRAEVAALTVRILGYGDSIIVGQEKSFLDVSKDYWAFNNIQNAYKIGLIKGYPSGEFKPTNNITYAEVVSIMVNALGKGNDLVGSWPDNYMNRAKELGIIPNTSTLEPNKVITRGQMAVIVWETLLVKE